MRFQKMLKLEEQSALDYQSLLEECKRKHKEETEVQASLKKLITDEKKHARLVRTLLNIAGQQAD